MKIAKVLGPRPKTLQKAIEMARKMMPNPKSGTVVPNLKQAIQEATANHMINID